MRPQRANRPTVEGCPVIELYDSSTDVKHLLNALYNPLIFSKESLPFPFIAAIVRMGRKYEFRNLLAAAVQRLTYENPTTLEAYTRLIASRMSYKATKIEHDPALIFDTIALARENDLFAVLPCAYLRATIFHTREMILDGVSRGAGPPVTLSIQDQRILHLALKKVVQVQWDRPELWGWLSSDQCASGCTDNLACVTRKKKIVWSMLRDSVPFAAFLLTSDPKFCRVCNSHHLAIIAAERRKLWDDLPSFFNLPPWGELKNDL